MSKTTLSTRTRHFLITCKKLFDSCISNLWPVKWSSVFDILKKSYLSCQYLKKFLRISFLRVLLFYETEIIESTSFFFLERRLVCVTLRRSGMFSGLKNVFVAKNERKFSPKPRKIHVNQKTSLNVSDITN